MSAAPTVLDTILERKRGEVERAKGLCPPDQMAKTSLRRSR